MILPLNVSATIPKNKSVPQSHHIIIQKKINIVWKIISDMSVKEDSESKWDWASSRKIGFSCTNVMEGKKHSWWREQLEQMAATVLACQASSLPTREVSLLNLLPYQTHTQPNLRISPASSLLEKENHIHFELLNDWYILMSSQNIGTYIG